MIRGPERSAAARRLACWAALLAPVSAGLIGGGRVSATALALRREDSFARLPYGVRGGGGTGDPESELPCRDGAASARTCEELGGAGSFDAVCVIASSSNSLSGSVEVRAGVSIACGVPGCRLVFNVSGSIAVGERAELVAGSVGLHAANVSLGKRLGKEEAGDEEEKEAEDPIAFLKKN